MMMPLQKNIYKTVDYTKREPTAVDMTKPDTDKENAQKPDIALRAGYGLLIGLCILLILVKLTMHPLIVFGSSMMPTYSPGTILFSESNPLPDNLDYDAIVAFKNDRTGGKRYIKRIVALPGDTVSVTRGVLYVNGSPEKQRFEVMNDDMEELTVPDNCCFVLGDNRNNSIDSRILGPVKFTDITNRVLDNIVIPTLN